MKTLLNYKLLFIAGIFLICLPSCDDITDLNIDPNNPVDVPAINLVTQAQYQLNDLLWGRGLGAEWGMLMVQHFAQTEYAEESRYTVDANDYNFAWERFYASILNELRIARDMIANDENVPGGRKANQLAIVDILRAYAFHNLTDLYGDAPYSQALNSIEYPLPAYDSQQAIYTAVLQMYSDAVNSMDLGSGSFDNGDLVYGGDIAAWKKLGASLMLRAAMRMVDVDQGAASGYIQQAVSAGVISDNADNGLFVFSTEAAIANPLYIDNTLNNRDDFAVTDVLVEHLQNTGDPRLTAFAKPNNSGDYLGLPYGLTDGESFSLQTTRSRPNDNVRAATAPAIMIDAAEVHFLIAEGVQRGILSGDAAGSYADGVRASMNYWGFTDDAAIDAYIAANGYDAGNWKESIGTQKWLALYMNGPQAWHEQRRLDQPVLAVPAAATNPSIPVRLPYPIDEEIRNGSNLSSVTSDPNDLNTKMWWDVN